MCGEYIWVHTKLRRLGWEIEFQNAICYIEDVVEFSKRTEIDSIQQTDSKFHESRCNLLLFQSFEKKIHINIYIVVFNWVQPFFVQ